MRSTSMVAGRGARSASSTFGRSRAASLACALTAAFAFAGCAGCDPQPGEDGGPTPDEAQLAFLSPLNNAVLTPVDDLDAVAEGFQITVRVLVDPASDAVVRLFVDDTEVASVDAANGRAQFTNVTLSASVDGVEHALRAEADGYKNDSITVTARASAATPSCEFDAPVGTTVESPVDVVVSCLNVGANAAATLRVLDADGELVEPAYSGVLDGNRRFTVDPFELAEGSYTLAFALTDFPAASIEKAITVEDGGNLPTPTCVITAPTAAAPPTTSPGFEVTVECEDVPAGVTDVTVTLDGASTEPVSFSGTLAAAGNQMAAVVPVTAAEAGPTEISAAVTNFPTSAGTVTVEVPAFPVCDAEIVQPADGATNLFDVDLDQAGNQITLTVGAAGSPGTCTGAAVEVFVDGASAGTGVLAGNAAQSGTATFVVTVPEGASQLSATLTLNGAAGASDTASITFTSPPVGIRFVGIPECGGFGDGCFNLASPNEGNGVPYQRTLDVEALAQNGSCPFSDPLLDVDGGDQDVRADGDTDAEVGDAWTLDNGRCLASFSLVTLHADDAPDGIILPLTLEVALVGGDSETRTFQLGLDRVAPTLTWTTADGELFAAAEDQVPETAIVDAAIGASVTGMEGRSVLLVASDDPSTALDTCVLDATGACAFVVALTDGSYVLDAVGSDAAGNALVGDVLDIGVDSSGPCVASIGVAADADADGVIGGSGATVTTDVTVTFAGDACAIEDGRTVTLTSTLGGDLGAATTSGNAVTFTGVSLAEGTHTLSADATDAAGNGVVTSDNAYEVTVDLTPPTCAIFLPTEATLNAADDEDTVEPGLQVGFEVTTDGTAARLLVDGTEASAGAAAGGVFNAVLTLVNGAPSIEAECTDAAGNVATSDAYQPTVDGSLPTVAFTAPAPTSLGSGDDGNTTLIGVQTNIDVDVSLVEAGRTVSIFRVDGAGARVGNALGSAVTATDTTGGGSETVSIPASFLSCENCSYVAVVADAAGNEAVSAPITLTVSGELYVCTFTNPDGADDPLRINDVFASGSGASVSFVVDCPGLTTGTAELFVNDFTTAAQTVAVTGATVTFSAVSLPAGPGQVQVVVDDGVDIGGTDRRDFVVDVDAPVVTWSFTTETVRLTRNALAAADVGPLDNQDTAGYQATLSATVTGCDDGSVVVSAGGVTVNAGEAPVAGTNPVSLPVSIPDGADQDLVVSCSDDVGNVGSDSVTADVDTVPPAAPADFTAALNAAADATRLGWVDIDFTMPGDDGTSGTVSSVSLVAAHLDVPVASFDTPAAPFVSIPLTAATPLPITTGADGVPALWFGPHTWSIVLRATDDVGNVADADAVTAAIELPKATVAFDLTLRTIDDEETDVATGATTPDEYGEVLNTATGDVNGDGRPDLVWSAWNEGSGCAFGFCNGALYVLYGQTDAAAFAAQTPQRIEGPTGSTLGYELAIVPSIDGEDAIDDLLVNAFDALGRPAVFVFYGVNGGQLNTTHDTEIADTGTFSFAAGLYGLGDVNGDAIGDWAAVDDEVDPPRLYVFFGSAAKLTSADNGLRSDLADVTLLGPSNNASFGPVISASRLGDLDADGFDDFVVGQGTIDSENAIESPGAGRLYVLRGRNTTTWGSATPVSLEGITAPDQKIIPAGGTRVGGQVTRGDVDATNGVDIVAAANGRVVSYLNDGSGTFVPGPRFATNVSMTTSRLGVAVGDTNGDGLDDVAVAATHGLYLYLSTGGGTVTRTVPNVYWNFGTSAIYTIAAPGDLDGDGFADLATGTRTLDTLHVLYGP